LLSRYGISSAAALHLEAERLGSRTVEHGRELIDRRRCRSSQDERRMLTAAHGEELLAEFRVALVERVLRPSSAATFSQGDGRRGIATGHGIAQEIELLGIGQSAEIARLGQLASDGRRMISH
jgi:hypothetical protein